MAASEEFRVEGSETPSCLDPETIQAYCRCEYRVFGANPFTLTVGVLSPELALLHERHDVRESAYLTACNPWGRLTDAESNRQAQARLAAVLASLGLPWLEAKGVDPDRLWPGEASFLVLGLARGQACELGRAFCQNAVVYCGAQAVPELLLLR